MGHWPAGPMGTSDRPGGAGARAGAGTDGNLVHAGRIGRGGRRAGGDAGPDGGWATHPGSRWVTPDYTQPLFVDGEQVDPLRTSSILSASTCSKLTKIGFFEMRLVGYN